LKADIAKLEFVTNVEVATLSQLPSINEAISRRIHSPFGYVGRMDQAAPAHQFLSYISQSRHDRAQGSLTPGRDNQVVRDNAGWSRSPRAQCSLLLMLGVLRRIGQHGGRYDRSTVKRRERECMPTNLTARSDTGLFLLRVRIVGAAYRAQSVGTAYTFNSFFRSVWQIVLKHFLLTEFFIVCCICCNA